MRSQTLQRLRALRVLMPLSLLPGALDLICVWLIARLTGSLVSNGLGAVLPARGLAGQEPYQQSITMIALFVLFCWLASAAKLGLRFRQQRLSARIWRDLSDLIYARLLQQPCAFHLSESSAELSSRVLANLNHLASNVITPLLQLISGVASILLLSLGIVWIGRWLAVALVIGLVIAYLIVSVSVTPRLRAASNARLAMEARSSQVLLESIHAVRDIQLTSSESYFCDQFGRAD